ncbi:MAG TPA: glycerate kinase [Acidimicrobiales bacterium]|nr:glycerate kinase [Acidimicrobiales bacterium]
MPLVLAVPDKFKGTATSSQVAAAIATGARASGWTAVRRPMSDGGEGLLEVVGGPNRATVVTGPLGQAVAAAWRFDDTPLDGTGVPTAVIEMAQAAGLVLAGGREHNDALAATTRGVGELIVAAMDAGGRRLVVGCGGSATTDGGQGALEVLAGRPELAEVEIIVACDVRVGFLEAATRFAAQKGASPEQVRLLEGRLGELADRYADEFGTDVAQLEGAGAAGGLAGGLAAIGGKLVSGFELVASLVRLDECLRVADAVVTGEGYLDEQSFMGKVVGEVSARAGTRPTLCVAGGVSPPGARAAAARGLSIVSLSERYGEASARARPLALVGEVVARWLSGLVPAEAGRVRN